MFACSGSKRNKRLCIVTIGIPSAETADISLHRKFRNLCTILETKRFCTSLPVIQGHSFIHFFRNRIRVIQHLTVGENLCRVFKCEIRIWCHHKLNIVRKIQILIQRNFTEYRQFHFLAGFPGVSCRIVDILEDFTVTEHCSANLSDFLRVDKFSASLAVLCSSSVICAIRRCNYLIVSTLALMLRNGNHRILCLVAIRILDMNHGLFIRNQRFDVNQCIACQCIYTISIRIVPAQNLKLIGRFCRRCSRHHLNFGLGTAY